MTTLPTPNIARFTDRPAGRDVTRIEVEALGYRFVAYATPLPGEFDGGHPDTHRLVTVIHPDGTDAWVFDVGGWLSAAYVDEKMRSVAAHHRPDHIHVIGWTIGQLLGRTYDYPEALS